MVTKPKYRSILPPFPLYLTMFLCASSTLEELCRLVYPQHALEIAEKVTLELRSLWHMMSHIKLPIAPQMVPDNTLPAVQNQSCAVAELAMNPLKILLCAVAFLFQYVVSQSAASSQAPTVTVTNGTYSGVYQPKYRQDFFLGVPYAQPPIGSLRYRIPASLNATWSGTRNATAYSPECVGYGVRHSWLFLEESKTELFSQGDDIGYESSEDCLTLNVIRPSGMEGQSLPIAFWIHGCVYHSFRM